MKQTKLIKALESGQLVDTHCHFNDDKYDKERGDFLERMAQSGVEFVVDIPVDLKSSKKSQELVNKYPQVLSSVGIDPEIFIVGSDLYNKDFDPTDFSELESILKDNEENVVLIGETGIDMYWNEKNNLDTIEKMESLNKQSKLFKSHIKLAKKYGLPLSIHSRNAIDECLDILEAEWPEAVEDGFKGVFHSLTPDLDDDEASFSKKIDRIIASGYKIGLNGIITYKSAGDLRNVVLSKLNNNVILRVMPFVEWHDVSPACADRKYDIIQSIYNAGFVFETDGPFLAPEGKRGELNEPANTKLVYQFLTKKLKN